jgi:hypothetical protein
MEGVDGNHVRHPMWALDKSPNMFEELYTELCTFTSSLIFLSIMVSYATLDTTVEF